MTGPAAARTAVPRLLVLTDRHQVPGGDLVAHLAACAGAGLTHVLLRELDLPDPERAGLARRISGLGLTVVAAHRLVPHAAGVHLPAHAADVSGTANHEPPAASRQGAPLLRGRSCHCLDEVMAAAAGAWTTADVSTPPPADYVTLGPYAPTRSKPGYRPRLHPDQWAGICAASPVPVLALGGIDPERAATVRRAGAHGVAVMGAVMRAPTPASVVRQLLEAVR